MSIGPPTDIQTVLDGEIKEWHFHIYFHQKNEREREAALKLRDAVLRLRRDGAFVAVPLHRVNLEPIGPHPVGSYEIWAPSETFSSVFSYLSLYRGDLSILVHPLTKEQVNEIFPVIGPWALIRMTFCSNPADPSTLASFAPALHPPNITPEFRHRALESHSLSSDHEIRNAWIGPAFPLDLATLPLKSEEIPLQYPSLKLGYSGTPALTVDQRRKLGDRVEAILADDKEAAHAPPRSEL